MAVVWIVVDSVVDSVVLSVVVSLPKTAFKAFLGVLAGLAIIIGSSCFVITNETEYSLVRQFGKIDHVVSEAGVSLKLPFIQSVDTLPKQTLIYDLASSDVITSDKKTMICDSYILWHITDPIKFAQTLNGSVSNAENRLDTIVYNATKNVISSVTQEQVISGRDGELSLAVMENIGTTLSQYGIELLDFETKQLDLPSDNKSAVYERMISERDNIAATYTAEGSAEAQIIRNTTDKEVHLNVKGVLNDHTWTFEERIQKPGQRRAYYIGAHYLAQGVKKAPVYFSTYPVIKEGQNQLKWYVNDVNTSFTYHFNWF